MEQRKSKKNIITVLIVLAFILLDQIIKLYIKHNLMGIEIDIFGEFLGFKPKINTAYSWINSMGELGIGLITHIILNVILLLISILLYDFISTKYTMYGLAQLNFCFVFAGAFCSLIDKIAWGGSLDFIWLKGFFIFDVKDVYLTCFEAITISMLIFNYKGLRKLNEKVFFKDLGAYIKLRFIKEQ